MVSFATKIFRQDEVKMGSRVVSGARNSCMNLVVPFLLVLASFMSVSNPVSAKTGEDCIEYFREHYYIKGRNIGSRYLTMEARLSIDPAIFLFREKDNSIEQNGIDDIRYHLYKIVYIQDGCEFNETRFFGNGKKPIVLIKKENIYLYFKSQRDGAYRDEGHSGSEYYGAGYYKFNVFDRVFEKIELSHEVVKTLDAYGEVAE